MWISLVLLGEPYRRGPDQWTIIRALHGLQMKMDHYLSAKPVPAEDYDEAQWPLYSHAQREGLDISLGWRPRPPYTTPSIPDPSEAVWPRAGRRERRPE